MDDCPPLAVPLDATPESLVEQAKRVADGEEAVTVDREGAADAVGITMITGYLGAGKTTVSGIDFGDGRRIPCFSCVDTWLSKIELLVRSFLLRFRRVIPCYIFQVPRVL